MPTIQDGFGSVAASFAEGGVGSWMVCKGIKTSCTKYFSLRDTWNGSNACFLILPLALDSFIFLGGAKSNKPLKQGSWHSKRRLACQYCGAVSFLNAGEAEGMLYTAFGLEADHRSTNLAPNF